MVVLLYMYKWFFVITKIVCTPIGTGTTLRKNRSMRVPIYSIDSEHPGSGSDSPIGSDRRRGVTY